MGACFQPRFLRVAFALAQKLGLGHGTNVRQGATPAQRRGSRVRLLSRGGSLVHFYFPVPFSSPQPSLPALITASGLALALNSCCLSPRWAHGLLNRIFVGAAPFIRVDLDPFDPRPVDFTEALSASRAAIGRWMQLPGSDLEPWARKLLMTGMRGNRPCLYLSPPTPQGPPPPSGHAA